MRERECFSIQNGTAQTKGLCLIRRCRRQYMVVSANLESALRAPDLLRSNPNAVEEAA